MTSLPELAHVDTRLGLSRAGDCLPLYLRFLARFPEDDSLTGLMSALGEGDMQTAFSCAHALKGLSAQLGILCVSEAASRICELLRPLDPAALGDAREAAKTLCALHSQVCREIAQLPAR